LNPTKKTTAIQILFDYLADKSKIVFIFALQALSDFALADINLRPQVIRALEQFSETGSPAVKNRAKKLLKKLLNCERSNSNRIITQGSESE